MDDYKSIALMLFIYFFAVYVSWVLMAQLPPKWIMKKECASFFDLYDKGGTPPPWRHLNMLGKSIELFFRSGGVIAVIIMLIFFYECVINE